jgi:hypothetical protein
MAILLRFATRPLNRCGVDAGISESASLLGIDCLLSSREESPPPYSRCTFYSRQLLAAATENRTRAHTLATCDSTTKLSQLIVVK